MSYAVVELRARIQRQVAEREALSAEVEALTARVVSLEASVTALLIQSGQVIAVPAVRPYRVAQPVGVDTLRRVQRLGRVVKVG